MKTPLLFLVFNRPEPTRRVFEEIRKARPEKLFVAADGPRLDRPEDVGKCRLVREVIKNIDWPCEVKTLFQEKNLGCKLGATTGINWFFDNVDEGIILEDDCLPDPSFFPFCEEMLEYYRKEKKLAIISGHNVIGSLDTKYSYIFTRYGHLWGWATWKQAWKQYDISMKIWANNENLKKIKRAIDDRERWNYKQIVYQSTFEGEKDTWDYQWEPYRLLNQVMSIIPKENMIENLGFGEDATHTKAFTSPMILPRRRTVFPLKHNPGPIVPDETYDKALGPKTSMTDFYKYKIKKEVKKIINALFPFINLKK
mgnify:CR=1 FL=1